MEACVSMSQTSKHQISISLGYYYLVMLNKQRVKLFFFLYDIRMDILKSLRLEETDISVLCLISTVMTAHRCI